jgi:hypothetical protein
MKRFIYVFLLIIFSSNVFGVMVTDDIINGCSLSQNFIAQFQIKTIVCQQNTYLPADAETCEPCLSGYVCTGGTFTFNETTDQGITLDKHFSGTIQNACPLFSNNMYATFALKSITCNPGYYLGADNEFCTVCPLNHYCPGGTFTFNETTPQGIIECQSNHPFAPAGMWQQSQCGRKLHVGEDILYMHQQPAHPTTHRLFVKYGNTTYSANAIQKSENNMPMSANATHSLHITINGIEYLIHDDSVE